MTKALRLMIRIEIFRLRRNHHAMRIKFWEDDNATEQDAVNVMRRDNNIRYKIQELKKILKSKEKAFPQLKELYSY